MSDTSVVIPPGTDPGSGPGTPGGTRWGRLRRFDEAGVLVVLLAMVAVVSAFHPQFVEQASLSNMAMQAAFYGIIAVGMVFVLSMGEVDLSVAGNFAFSAMTAALLARSGMNLWLTAIITIAVGSMLGLANAAMAAIFQVPLIIVTLGTFSAYRGMTQVISGAQSVTGGDPGSAFFAVLGGTVFGVPILAVALLVVTGVLWFVFVRTPFGFAVRAVGSNPNAAKLSGYPITLIRMQAATLLGALCGLSGLLSFAFFGATDPNVGQGYELLAVASAVIGGTALSGGRGSILGATLGALIVSGINGALTVFGVSINYAAFVTGLVIVAAVGADALLKRRVRRY